MSEDRSTRQKALIAPLRAPTGTTVHVVGLGHAEFGPDGLRGQRTLHEETAGRTQIAQQAGRGWHHRFWGDAMTPQEMEARLIRFGELSPCRTAFIDAHRPGSDRRENFSSIGGGVSEAADQHVRITGTPAFDIGAAGQPSLCRNSLHDHRTAEACRVRKGRWRCAGEAVPPPGDTSVVPPRPAAEPRARHELRGRPVSPPQHRRPHRRDRAPLRGTRHDPPPHDPCRLAAPQPARGGFPLRP